mgnify:FL=1
MARRFTPQGRRRFRPARNAAPDRLEALNDRKMAAAELDELYQLNMALLLSNPQRAVPVGYVQSALVEKAWARYQHSLRGRTDAMARHGLNFNSVGEKLGGREA